MAKAFFRRLWGSGEALGVAFFDEKPHVFLVAL